MVDVEKFLEEPGERDIAVKDVFKPKEFEKLKAKMAEVGWPDITDYWKNELKNRKIISEFMKDPLLGFKASHLHARFVSQTLSTTLIVMNPYAAPLSSTCTAKISATLIRGLTNG
mmetsp:Transcript_5217/g.7605  ORF Transcript_5217/g.7605 Transcript_5217/m.7605 type:complete len:115 (+) Transcript_5217:349-693(+)